MSNDWKPDDLSSLAGRVASAKRRSAAKGSQADGPKYLKYARAGIFLCVALSAIMLGLIFRSNSSSGNIYFVPPSEPVSLDVFVSNPYITVKLDLDVGISAYSGDNNGYALLNVSARAPQTVRSGTIVLISTIPDSSNDAKPTLMDNHESQRISTFPRTVYELKIPLRTPGETFWGRPIKSSFAFRAETYQLPGTVVQVKDRLFVGMPELEGNSFPSSAGTEFWGPALLSEKNPNTGQLIGFTDHPVPISGSRSRSTDPSSYHTTYGVPDAVLWTPKISLVEEIDGLGPYLRNDQIYSVLPTGTVKEDGYLWQGNDISLAPSLSAIDPNAAAKESTWDFRSGIAFGIAVGAGVAFVQELPDAIHPRRRWRKRHTKRS